MDENKEIKINKDKVNGVFDTMLDVTGFFQSIVDALANLLQPLFAELFKGILNK